ncbi:alkaline phosphatase [Thiocystis violacea]|uniref:alkaline phosphatase n=1 Tax=Thiocystis violacea TaxID=13725 RepID=UPI0019061549|nr:alkaline phosphatase [Thiocystis violacea]MBK1725176.1 alkaline phosphatase [Thiocystis violacea]
MKTKAVLTRVAAAALLTAAIDAQASQSKYVFFFLGDGMANAQIQAAEAYLTTINGGSAKVAADLLKPENRLHLTRMPVQGMQTTYDAYALMTDSASSATAFASGIKTKSGVINRDSEHQTTCYKSVAELAHDSGKRVGVITSVSLDHATPAAYYASVVSRGEMNSIATQLADSGYEFFGGGGLVKPTAPNDVWDLLEGNGYRVLEDRESILALKDDPMDKVVAINPVRDGSQAMPYAIDKPDDNLSLAEMTQVAIASLAAVPKTEKDCKHERCGRSKPIRDQGFFLMVEGGKIDWACHANDAVAAIGDTLDFDAAVKVAIDFAKKHPRDTLIVVTGDHETGGMTIGHATTAYTAYYDRLLGQENSFDYFNAEVWAKYKADNASVCSNGTATGDVTDAFKGLMSDSFGLSWNDLNEYQKEKIVAAHDQSLCGSNSNSQDENKLLYGSYEPITVTLTHILNERASIGWTSYSHTGVPVPVYAQGPDSDRFAGFYDNTDIAKRLAQIMSLRKLPVEKSCP